MTTSASPHPRLLTRSIPWILTIALGIAALLFTIQYVRSERFFYFWDSFAYHRATLESLQRADGGLLAWLHGLRDSIQSGFSQLFTTPLILLMRCFGDDRAVYICGLVGCFLLPFAWVTSRIVNRMTPVAGAATPLVFATCAALPVLWRATLSGYPDIGGVTIAMLAVLVHFRDPTMRYWRTALSLGGIFALSFLFRRHLIYVVFAMMATISFFTLIRIHAERLPRKWMVVAWALLRMSVVPGIVVTTIALIAPTYFAELTSTNFRELYKPFQQSQWIAFDQHWNLIGTFYWAVAATGFALAWRDRRHRWEISFLVAYLAVSFAIWTLYLRYLSIQYNLHFAFVIACGVGALVAVLWNRGQYGRYIAGGIALLVVGLWVDRLSTRTPIPSFADGILPSRLPPLRDCNYNELARLVLRLRSLNGNPSSPVLVAASSIVINSDMLTNGEGALFGRTQRRIAFMNGSHADTVQPYTLRDLIAADWVVHVSPLQLHLRLEDQGVVESEFRAFSESWPIARDFVPDTEVYHLQPGIEARIFRRLRRTGLPAQIDTARRIFDRVGVCDAWTGVWMMGQAATGAEYFDARLIVPRGRDVYFADLNQVRPPAEQPSVTIFGRVIGYGTHMVTGVPSGTGVANWTMKVSLWPDAANPSGEVWRQDVVLANGTAFAIRLPTSGPAVLAIELVPTTPLSTGTPLGWGIEQLHLHTE